MGLLVDVRKYHIDNLLNDLVNASKIKKGWFKTTDNYWSYLDTVSTSLPVDLNSHIVADLFVYIQEELKYQEVLHQYSSTVSKNRNAFVTLVTPQDRDFLTQLLLQPSFYLNFKDYALKLNGEYYNYTDSDIKETIEKFVALLNVIDKDNGLIVNVG
jgi:hypothetical protein